MTGNLTKGLITERLINIYRIRNESADVALSMVMAVFKDTPGFQSWLPRSAAFIKQVTRGINPADKQ